MSQYPDEKDPHSNWVYPQDPSPTYTSRDGAPAPPPQGYYPPPQPPQGYYPPASAPPDYGYAVNHPEGRSTYDHKAHDMVLAPPPSNEIYSPPNPASSSAQDSNQGSNAMSLGAFFGNKGTPPMWSRPAAQHLPYSPFSPMCLISNGKELSGGFPELPPPCQLSPHPFATHDVTEEDWKRFLADVKRAGSLSGAQRIKSNVIPMVMGMGFVSGFIMTHGIEKRMKFKDRGAAGDVVDHWNHYFFGPRRIEVVLSQGSERLSGKHGAAPVGDPNQQRLAYGLRKRGEDSVSDSSSDDGRHDKRGGRRERREARRARKAERREWKARGDDQEPYQLFVTSA